MPDNFPGTGFDTFQPGIPGWFVGIFIVFGLIFTAAIIAIVIIAAKRYRAVRNTGADPFTVDAELIARAAQSDLLKPAAPAKTLEQRLAELTDLHSKGVITDDELAQARADILRS